MTSASALSRILWNAREQIAEWIDVVEARMSRPHAHGRVVLAQIDAYRAERGWSPHGFGGESDDEPEPVTCWFCDAPARRVGWGFTVCGNGLHAERARLTGDPRFTPEERARALRALDRDEERYRAEGRPT